MRNFLLLCMAALCCLACNDSKIVTVTVTNPLAMDRSDEMVEVSMTEISNLLNLADTAQIVVLNVVGSSPICHPQRRGNSKEYSSFFVIVQTIPQREATWNQCKKL